MRPIFVLCLSCLVAGVGFAKEGLKSFKTIQVSVSSDNITLQEEAESYLKREFRSLGDITLVDKDPDLEFTIIANVVTAGTKEIGYAISLVAVEHHNFSNSVYFAAGALPKDKQKTLHTICDDAYSVKAHYLNVLPISALKTTCEQIVAKIDSTILEPERKEWDRISKAFDSMEQKEKASPPKSKL
jgi:hypothetical protein